MLARTAKGTEVSIHFIQDVDPNIDGWYCEIYLYDEDGEAMGDRYDDFCIYPEDCPDQGCYDKTSGSPTGEAEEYARKYVESIEDY